MCRIWTFFNGCQGSIEEGHFPMLTGHGLLESTRDASCHECRRIRGYGIHTVPVDASLPCRMGMGWGWSDGLRDSDGLIDCGLEFNPPPAHNSRLRRSIGAFSCGLPLLSEPISRAVGKWASVAFLGPIRQVLHSVLYCTVLTEVQFFCTPSRGDTVPPSMR
jgi:hypothetical protein